MNKNSLLAPLRILYNPFLWFFRLPLPTQILTGLVLGVILGFLLKENIAWVEPFGTAFIRLITMIVVPLVFASLLVGTASLGDPKKLGRIGGKTLIFFLVTTVISCAIGLGLANTLKPGSNLPQTTRDQIAAEYLSDTESRISAFEEKPAISDILVNIIPKNPFDSLAKSAMLQIIFFAIFFGITLTMIPVEKAKPIISFFEGVNQVMIKMILVIMKVAPIGVFALIAVIVAKFGWDILSSLLMFTLIVIFGCLFHMFTVLPLALKLLTKMKVTSFFKGIFPAQLIALTTTSSGATLPVTMECCEKNLKVPNEICSFVLPLGATINMNGTSLYQGVAALFLAEVYIPGGLSFVDQLIVVGTATLGAIGTAGVPGAAVILLAVVLQAVGIPLEGIALVLGVDRIVDMFRTPLNITGDAICAVYVATSEGLMDTPQDTAVAVNPKTPDPNPMTAPQED